MMCGLPHEAMIAAPAWDQKIEDNITAAAPESGPEAVSIVWSNRGLASDNFAATFGTSAGTARAVVDAALNDWEQVITSWNRADGTTSLQVNISIGGTGFGGAGAPDATAPADGKPRTGSFTLNAGNPAVFPDVNDSNGWYLDANPEDHGEFNDAIDNAFAGRGTGIGSDFYSVVIAEMTHVLGLISDKNNSGGSFNGYRLESSGLATNTAVNDNAEGGGSFGDFWVFNGPTVDHLMTSYNSGDQNAASWGNVVHSAGVRPTPLNFGGQLWQGSEDAGNASYAGGQRILPSWAMAHVLRDAYGYSIIDPEAFGTFYANLNRTTGVLTVRGGDAHSGSPISNDQIFISTNGSTITVSVDVPVDVPGTQALSGAGDFPAWTSTFNNTEVTSIVIDGEDGDDDIFLYGIQADVPVIINAGNGNDFIQIGDGDVDDINTGVQGNVTVNGGAGTDGVSFFDFLDEIGNDTYTITSSTVQKTASSTSGVLNYNNADIESITLTGNPQNDTFLLNSADATVNYIFNGFNGNDTLVVGTGDFDTAIDSDSVSFSGGAGTDLVRINDSTDIGNDTYQVSGNAFTKPSFGTGRVVATSTTEQMVILGSNANDTWSVPQLSSFLDVTLTGGSGDDSFSGFFNNNFDSNLLSSLTFQGGAGTDDIIINDQGSVGLDYNLDNNSLDKGGAGIFNYSTSESLVLNCNALSNNITVLSTSSSCPLTINGFAGDDSLNVNDGTSFLFNFGSDITFNGGTGTSDDVNITDTAFGGTGTYTATNGHVVLPFNGADVFHTGTENLLINGSNGNNTINIDQTNILTLVLGDDGDDIINVGNGDFDSNITADVLVLGGIGTNVAVIEDTLDAGDNTWTITAGSVHKDTGLGDLLTSFFGPTIDNVRIDAGAGNSTFNINSIGSSTTAENLTINAGAGNDTVSVAAGDVNGDLYGDVVVNGESGVDAMTINDTADTASETWTITNVNVTATDWASTLTYGTLENFTLEGSGVANTVTVNSTFGATAYLLKGNGGADNLNVVGNNAVITLDGGAGLDNVNINADAVGTASARFANNQDLALVNIGLGGLLSLNASKLLVDTQTSSINGRLDLSNGGFIDRAAAAEGTYRPRLVTGYAAGAWTTAAQPAIFSSAAAGGPANDALGYGFASEVGAAAFFGSAVAAGDFLIRYTLYGDADLSGGVNLDDFTRLAAAFGTPANWSRGNSNYDANVNLDDFTALAANFGLNVPADLPRAVETPASSMVGAVASSMNPFSTIPVGSIESRSEQTVIDDLLLSSGAIV